MNDNELEILLRDLESDTVERKTSLADRDKICQVICAFANDLPDNRKPGVVFIGANDDGSCARLEITEQLLITLANMRSDGNILPMPAMTVEKKRLGSGEFAVVIVQPSDAPPVRYKGRTYIRVGPRRAVATLEEERRLGEKRLARDLPYDIRPVSSATFEDLDLDMFKRVYLEASVAPDILEQNERTAEEQLASLRFFTGGQEPKPTVLGVLVIGIDPQQYIPGAYIQFLRIDGVDLTDPIKDQKEIAGPLPEMLRILDDLFQVHISSISDITTQAVEIRRSDYPIVALQQLARNAVLHRTYEGTHAPVRITWFSNRIEIQNPGGPFGQVNRENFGRPGVADYRNPHLAEAMKNLGYVQRFGVGIQLARKELQKNGNPPPDFDVQEAHVLAVLRKRS